MSTETVAAKKLTTPQLFRTLKADDAHAKDALALAANAAQKRWPLLQSTRPEKWLPTPKLTAGEKQDRFNADVTRSQLSPSEAPLLSVPSIDSRIASGLSRMLFQKLKSVVGAAPTVAPINASENSIEPLASKPIDAAKPAVTETVLSQTLQKIDPKAIHKNADDSIQSMLQRLEKSPVLPNPSAQRPPSFLARLGIR
jgi:hypothetical protein